MIKVKNLNGTSDNKVHAGYSSWFDFWEKKTGKEASKCSHGGCAKKATDGVHIQKAGHFNVSASLRIAILVCDVTRN